MEKWFNILPRLTGVTLLTLNTGRLFLFCLSFLFLTLRHCLNQWKVSLNKAQKGRKKSTVSAWASFVSLDEEEVGMSSIIMIWISFQVSWNMHCLVKYFKKLPCECVCFGSSAQSERGRWKKRRPTCVTSAYPLPRTQNTDPREEYGSNFVRRQLYHIMNLITLHIFFTWQSIVRSTTVNIKYTCLNKYI